MVSGRLLLVSSALLFVAGATAVQAGELPSVVLNEVVSHPASGEKEWVEIYNTGTAPIDLAGWYLTDLTNPQGTSTQATLKLLTGVILPNDFMVFEVGTTKLNNAGDSVGLYTADALEIDRVTLGPNVAGYTANSRNPALSGLSASRFGSAWIVAPTSKGGANTLPAWAK